MPRSFRPRETGEGTDSLSTQCPGSSPPGLTRWSMLKRSTGRASGFSAWIAGSSPAMTTSEIVLAMHRTRVMQQTARKFRLQKKGRRSADRRIHPLSAPHIRMLPRERAPGAEARHTLKCCHLKVSRARSPLGAPTAVLAAQINATAQPRPRFARTGGHRRYPHHRTRLQRCTSHTGHSAGRVDAQAARERGYKSHPQEPHSPYQSAVTGDIPS